jgi:hypothetical protein
MEKQLSSADVHEIKARVEKMAAFQMGAFGITVGIAWVGLAISEFLLHLDSQIPLLREKPYNIEYSLACIVLLICGMVVTVLVGYYQYRFYTGRFGTWLPSIVTTMTQKWIFTAGIAVLLVALFLQEMSNAVFPWIPAAFFVMYFYQGLADKPRRWYYPAFATIMIAVSFVPFLAGAEKEIVNSASYTAFGLFLLITGWIDHRHLMGLNLPPVKENAAA